MRRPGRDRRSRLRRSEFMTHTDQLTQRLLGRFDVPAYVRRGLRVAQGRAAVVAQCRQKRRELLCHAKWRAGQLRRALSDPEQLERLLPRAAERDHWNELWDVLEASGDVAGGPPPSSRRLRRMVRETCESLERFNRAWLHYLNGIDLMSVNREIEAYNRYYLLEKECALRSPRLVRQGYRPLAPLSIDDLFAQFPLLPVPRLTE